MTATQQQPEKELRVLLSEGNQDWEDTIKACAEESGALVVAVASSFVESLDKIKQVVENQIDLVVFGGSLDNQIRYDNSDVALLVLALQQVNSEILTISAIQSNEKVAGVTIEIGKKQTFATDFSNALNTIMLGKSSKDN